MIEDIFSMIAAFIGIICVIILTYYVSKWYARRMGTIAGGKHIRIVDRLIVGKTGSIMIIDVEGTQYMVGVNEHRIEIMKQLDAPVQIVMMTETGRQILSAPSNHYYIREKDTNNDIKRVILLIPLTLILFLIQQLSASMPTARLILPSTVKVPTL